MPTFDSIASFMHKLIEHLSARIIDMNDFFPPFVSAQTLLTVGED